MSSGSADVGSIAAEHSTTLQQRFPGVLFITLDGILEPLGQSQILPYVRGLARAGFRYHLLTMERSIDLQGDGRERLEKELSREGIGWTWAPYDSGGISAIRRNCATLARRGKEIITREDIRLVHARSYVPAGVSLFLKQTIDVPYLFDMRGYWIDERAADGRWFTNPLAYRAGKLAESALIHNASAIVTLTRLQAFDVLNRVRRGTPVVVIPTCADFNRFQRRRSRFSEQFAGKLVVGYVGSINASYLQEPAFGLFRYLHEFRTDAHLLCLTRQPDEMRRLLLAASVPAQSVTVATASHADMPEWLSVMDWGLLLLQSGLAKRGSMPTKLAEFLAANVRPIQYGCNTEVGQWVCAAGGGIVLDSIDDQSLRAAAKKVAATPLDPRPQAVAPEIRQHFGLEAGIRRYECLLREFFAAKSA